MKKTGFFLVIVSVLLVCIGSTQAEAKETGKKDVFSIQEPTWIFKAGMSKGKNHDRQDLGFILRENTVLKVRQANPAYKQPLTVRLLGNDSATEKSVKVGSDWTTVSGTEALVPFVDTPYGESGAQLEYEVDSEQAQKPLPVYAYHGDAETFFQTWDDKDGNYALIKGKDFQLLIPKRDKNAVRNLKDYASLDELIAHYQDLFAYYNQIAGFDDSSAVNKNGSNRYFLKADSHGAGGAYYGGNWTANSYATTDMWLTKVDWATLHEIAHGYQAGFDGQGMYTGEVSNNLFGVQYQYEKYGKKADQIGWLFNYGKKEAVEKNLYTKMVKQDGTYGSVDLREKLILLTMLKQKAGNEAFTKMYQGYRELANQNGFSKTDYPLPDLLNRYYSETSKQDFTPVLQRWGLVLADDQAVKNRAKSYPAIASLADIIPESKLASARTLVDPTILINSNFEMVQNKDIASLGLKGNLSIQLKAEDVKALNGAKLQLKDGTKMIAEQTVEGETLDFKQVPNGIYTVTFTGKEVAPYIADTHYVYVKEAQNDAKISLEKINISKLANQSIQLLGLGDAKFATFTTNRNDDSATLDVTAEKPHSYYSGETYAKVVVKDAAGMTRYEKTMEGTETKVGKDSFPFKEGDIVEIYHAETKNRLRSSESIIDKATKTNTLVMTKWGLRNKTLANDPQEDLIVKIKAEGTRLLNDADLKDVPFAESEAKKQLLQAIQLLDEPNRTVYLDNYQALFSE